jgi:hypothetical protein
MTTMLPTPQAFLDDAGLPVSGGKVYTYDSGTTNPRTSYSDLAGLTANANPITLDAAGRANIFGTGFYTLKVYRADGITLVRTFDGVGIGNIDVTNSTDPTQGSGGIPFNASLAYGAGSIGRWLKDLANSVGSTLIGFIQAGVGAVTRTLQDKLRESVDVTDFLPAGYVKDGSVDYSTQIQAAINALFNAGGGTLNFPAFTLSHGSTPLVFKNFITYKGKNRKLSKLNYTGTSDQVVIQNTLNGSTDASINIEDLWFHASSLAAYNGNVFDTGSSLLGIRRCMFDTNQVGLILDQTELGSFDFNYFAGQTGAAAGVWLVNGADKNAGSLTGFTNQLTFKNNQFNGSGAWIGVVDDGGNDHTYITNNFNTGTSLIRFAACAGFQVYGGEYESWTGSGMIAAATKWKGATAFFSSGISFKGGFYYVPGTNAAIDMQVASTPNLSVEDICFNTGGNPFSGMSNVAEIFAKGNTQGGAGSGVTAINNYFSSQSFTPTWTGATTNPSLGNGTLIGNWSRHGRRVEAVINLTTGTTTTYGSGNWAFSLPTGDAGIGDVFSVSMTCAGGLYVGVGKVASSKAGTIFTASSTSNAVQSTTPATWVSGNSLQATVCYLTNTSIG